MAHYDIYQSLGLDRSAPTGELDRVLADRMAATPQDDAAALDELTTARAVVGNDTRRSLYDQRLGDPNAEDIDVASLKELAALDVGPPAGQQGEQGQQGQAVQFARNAGDKAGAAGRQVQDSFRQSKGLAIGITAVVTAVVVLLVGWGLGALTGGDSGQQDDPDAIALVDDMLDHSDSDELRTWLRENTTYQYRDELMQAMNVGEGRSSSFSGMDSLFSGGGLHAQTSINPEHMAVLGGGADFESFVDDGFSEEEAKSRRIVGIADSSGDYKGMVAIIEQGGDLKIFNVINASNFR
ncbi:hypothetical protein [Corynebacterium sp. AOP12-C2-36]|uniref:hypothetical protein n=1 Tax=Corynebacterium sp. AOP12-C2-36 TaxID=3457723 RepID=UPI004033F1D2